MEWVTNAPASPSEHARTLGEMIKDYMKWRDQFTEGEPRATEACTVEALREMNMVGLYRKKP